MNRWRLVTERDTWADAPNHDAIEFVLTPREKDLAALAAVHLEANRRRLNRLDTAQSVADELSRLEENEDGK